MQEGASITQKNKENNEKTIRQDLQHIFRSSFLKIGSPRHITYTRE